MDILEAFFDDCCNIGEGLEVKSADLRQAYEKWAGENGEKAIGSRRFANKLIEKGFSGGKGIHVDGARGWKGLGLK